MSDQPIYVVSEQGVPHPVSSRKSRSSRYFKFVFIPLVALILIKSYLAMSSTHGHLPLNNPLQLRVYTHNIRYDNRGNRDAGEQPWGVRRGEVVNSIDFHTSGGGASVVCLQEVLHHQLEQIVAGLNRNADPHHAWTYYGVGRSDGLTSGEYAPVLYQPSQWRLVENQTLWLSPTPAVPSKGWDAALERILTMVTLQSTHNPLITINVFNTHFDHRGVEARRRSAEFIVDRMRNHNGYPSFLGGDFNTEPTDQPYAVLRGSGFQDSRTLIDPAYSYGANSTFSGFDHLHEKSTIIDYIWSPEYTSGNLGAEEKGQEVNPEKKHETILKKANGDHHKSAGESDRFGVVLKHFGILNNFNKGFHCSDHRPVVAQFEVSRKWF